MPRHLVRDEDRPVAAAGTTDGNRDVGLAFLFVLRNQVIHESAKVIEKFCGSVLRVHVCHYLRIRARQRLEVRHKIRIWKKADIEHQIRIDRNAILESETDQRKQEMPTVQSLKLRKGVTAQLVNRECRCIENMIGNRPYRRQ